MNDDHDDVAAAAAVHDERERSWHKYSTRGSAGSGLAPNLRQSRLFNPNTPPVPHLNVLCT